MQGHHAEILKEDLNTGPWVAFVDQNSSYIGETPHYMIREFLLGVARKYDLTINEWSNEYWGCRWMPKLLDFVSNPAVSGLIVPSVHAFSGTVNERMSMFETAVKNGKQIIFVDENLLVKSSADLDTVQKIYELTVV
jgi:hypothetical protein